MNRRLTFLLLLASTTTLACARGPTEEERRAAMERLALPVQTIEETVEVTLPDGSVIQAELADDPREMAVGLMGREEVPEGTGMLFVYGQPDHLSFWMKNCLVPLDIVWLAQAPGGGRVVHVKERAPPCRQDPCPSYITPRKALYVLELAGGGAARHGVARGRDLRFRLPDPEPGDPSGP